AVVGGRCVRTRQREGEPRAASGGAAHPEVTAHAVRQIAADREPQAGSFRWALEIALQLNERLEDHALLFARHSDAGVGHAEIHDARGRVAAGAVAVCLRSGTRTVRRIDPDASTGSGELD